MREEKNSQRKKIKIVYIMPTLDQGGAERALVNLILNLDFNIYEPSLILFKRGGLWLNELKAANIPVQILNKKWKIDFKNFFELFNILKQTNPQIVHTQLGGDLYGRIAARVLKIKIIVSTEQNLNPDENIINNFLKRITSRFAKKIIAISEAVKKDLIYRYKISENKISIIPNGIELNKYLEFSKNNKKEKTTKIILGTIGRLVPQKGHAILIKALAKLKDIDFECQIAGRGRQEIKLNKQIEYLGLTNKIKLIGAINDVPNFLNSLDIFVFPSLWEGQGIVLLEAALMNLPIIASEVDGIKEILNNETAYLVKSGDVNSLSKKISWLINNLGQETVTERSAKLKQEIINKYSVSRMSQDYQKLYQELLNTYENITS